MSKMRCCVPFCNTTAESVYGSGGVTFYKLPSEVHLRAAWLRALGNQDAHLPDSAAVCSQHFLVDDMYETVNGLSKIRTGAIPSTVQVCVMCLESHSKLYLMRKYSLEGIYETLMGQPLCDLANLKQTLCALCAQRLVNFSKFRDKSLRAHSLMMDLVKKHEFITIQHMKLIDDEKSKLKSNFVKTVLKPDHYDLYITHSNEDKQTDLESAAPGLVPVKHEDSHDFMSVDVNVDIIPKKENVSDDPLSEKPSTSKDLEVEAKIKSEITLECTICFKEFVDEDMFNEHMDMHMEENQKLEEDLTADYSDDSVADSPGVAINHKGKLHPNEVLDNFLKNNTSIIKHPKPQYVVLESDELMANIRNTMKAMQNELLDIREGETNYSNMASEKNYNNMESETNYSKVESETNYSNMESETNYSKVESEKNYSKVESGKNYSKVESGKNYSNLDSEMIPESSSDSLLTAFSEQSPFTCEVCQKIFDRKCSLDAHKKTHTIDKKFTCDICMYQCKYNSTMVTHMKTHSEDRPFSCKLCNYKCRVRRYLALHMRTHTGEKRFACEMCEYKSADKGALVMHVRTHTGERPFACKLCDYRCARKRYLALHMITHTGEKPFSCEYCHYKSGSKTYLVGHMRSHTGEKPYSCNVCGHKTALKSLLNSHMITHGVNTLSCQSCDYKCATNASLLKHMRRHTGEKPVSCTLCDYKCLIASELVVHMRTHTGEKPFSCTLCHYKCTVSSNLAKHMRTHTGEKPYSCNLCGYRCTVKNNLSSHMRTHTGEKAFSCELCEFKCATKNPFLNHMKTHKD